ncbi:MAG: hypothetical protein ACRDRL_27500, partial [Sciscionella sp.]
MTRTSHVATARTARSRRWHPIALLAGAVHRSARWNRAVSRRAMLGFVMTLALAVAAVGLTGTGTAGAQTQTAGAADGAGFTCVTSGGLIIGQGLPCDYGTSPPPLLNELALQSGTYAATPAQQASLSNVEQQAVANTISDHKLSASDTTAVQTWGRDDAEGELWALIVRAVSAVHAGTATPDQTNVDNWFTEVVRRQNVEAADDAGLEYAKWAGLGAASYQNLLATNPSKATLQSFLQGTPLNYTSAEGYRTPASADGEGYCLYQSPAGAPDGYTANIYTPITQSTAPQNCFTPDYSITGPIVPTPTLQQFQEWGGTDASRPFTSASFVLTSRDIAEGIGFGSSVIGAGAIAAGTSLALTPILTSVATSSGVSALAAFSSASGPLAALGGAELAGAVGGVAAASIAAIPAIA